MQEESQKQLRGLKVENAGKITSIWIGLLVLGFIIYTFMMPDKSTATKPEDAITPYAIGQSFQVDGVEFTVSKIESVDGTDARTIKVDYTAENKSKKEVSIYSTGIIIVDSFDREYKSGTSDDPGSLNPGIKKNGYVEFEVPKTIPKAYIGFRADMFDFGGADYGFVKIP